MQGLDALAGLIGDWEVAGTMLDLEGTPVAIQSAATIASGLEGRSIDERSSYLLPPHSVEFVCIRSWDEYRKQYRMACIDSLTGLLDVYEGALEDGRLVMTNLDTGTAAEVNGTRMYGRQTISEILPDSFLVTWEYSLDDGATWNQYGQLRYRRQGVEVGLAQE